MIFITFKVLNLVRSARNRLRPVWITFGIVYCVFPNTLKVPLQVFRYCSIFKVLLSTLSLSADSLFIIPQKWFLSSFIFEVLRFSELVSCNLLSASARNLTSSYWFFRFTSQRRLRSHSLSPRLVLEYNTTLTPLWQPLFSPFCSLCIYLTVFCNAKVRLSVLNLSYNILYKGLHARDHYLRSVRGDSFTTHLSGEIQNVGIK